MAESNTKILEVAGRPAMNPAQQDWIRACRDRIWIDLMLRLIKSAPVALSKPVRGDAAFPTLAYYRERLVVRDYEFFVRDTEIRGIIEIQETLPNSTAIDVVITTSWELS